MKLIRVLSNELSDFNDQIAIRKRKKKITQNTLVSNDSITSFKICRRPLIIDPVNPTNNVGILLNSKKMKLAINRAGVLWIVVYGAP